LPGREAELHGQPGRRADPRRQRSAAALD